MRVHHAFYKAHLKYCMQGTLIQGGSLAKWFSLSWNPTSMTSWNCLREVLGSTVRLSLSNWSASCQFGFLICWVYFRFLVPSKLFQWSMCKLALQAKWTSTENISFTISSLWEDSFPLCYMKLSLRAVPKVPLAVKSSYLVGSNLTLNIVIKAIKSFMIFIPWDNAFWSYFYHSPFFFIIA